MGVKHSHLACIDTSQSSPYDYVYTANKKEAGCLHSRPPSYNYNWTELHYAASLGNLSKIRDILRKQGHKCLNKKDFYGKTPLYWAAYKGHYNCMKELLKSGAHVNTQCRHGGTPLHAVASVYPESAILLINHGADVNMADNWGVTPMYLAATNAQIEVIKHLIMAGASLTHKNMKTGDLPKQLASHKEFLSYLQRLERNPRSLQELCRIRLRKSLGEHPQTPVLRLGLPSSMCNYVALQQVS